MRFILEIVGLFINILIVTVDLLGVFRPLCHSPWLIVILFLFVLIFYFNNKFFIHECGIIRPDSNFIHTPFMLWDWLSDYFIWFYLWKNRGTCNYLPKKCFTIIIKWFHLKSDNNSILNSETWGTDIYMIHRNIPDYLINILINFL